MNKRFESVDRTGLDQQIWAWRNEHSEFRITKIRAVERLPLQMKSPRPHQLIMPTNTVAVFVEYELAA